MALFLAFSLSPLCFGLLWQVPRLKTLLTANASQADPIVGLSITGVGFRDAAPTYMDPHGVPSGGDWALERMGALYIEGSIGLSIDDCQFERLDGAQALLRPLGVNVGCPRNAPVLRFTLSSLAC